LQPSGLLIGQVPWCATKNIPNYLAWHRIIDREGKELSASRFLAAAIG